MLNLRDSDYGSVIDPKTWARVGDVRRSHERFREGVLFLTYSTLISRKAGASRSSAVSRFYQLLHWCGDRAFDGVLVLDECHNAKTAVASGRSKKGGLSKTAQAICDLQQRLPNARVVYSSATGGSDEKEMVYMQRLGLWGAGTSYKTFADLATKLSSGGLSFLEMLCCDMKAKGAFVSRQLSFNGCAFSIREAALSPEMAAMYRASVAIWQELRRGFEEAIQVGAVMVCEAQLATPFAKHLASSRRDVDVEDFDDVEGVAACARREA